MKVKELTEKEILTILKHDLIKGCKEEVKAQVYAYAFGEEFMTSNDKGTLKEYAE